MKGKVRTRLLSALLTLAMLAGLMPAAFAASRDDYDYSEASMDPDDYLSLEFIDSDVPYDDYYIDDITADRDNDADEPDVVDQGDDPWDESYNYIDSDELDDFYFSSYDDSEGEYEYTFDIVSEDRDTDGEEFTLYVTIYVGEKGSTGDLEIEAETDEDGILDLDDLAQEIYDAADDEFTYGHPYRVKFTSRDGDLSDDDRDWNDNMYGVWVKFDDSKNTVYLEDYVYFTADGDEAEISFVVESEDSKDRDVSGTIYVDGEGSSSNAGDIKYTTEFNESVTFDADDFDALLDSGCTLDYVTFGSVSSTKGTLYTDDSEDEKASSSDKFYYEPGRNDYDLDEVTFAPKKDATGSVSISFTMHYENSRGRDTTAKGTVVITIDDGSTIEYAGEKGDSIYFDADDFADVCETLTGRDLDYVTFSSVSSSKGTLYIDDSEDEKASSSDKFYYEPAKRQNALDDVTFVPKSSGVIEIGYTAHSTRGSTVEGTVKITVTAGALSAINYTVSGSSVTFDAADFTAALKRESNKSLSSVTFTLPKSSEGVLYYNGNTKVSSSTQYKATGSTNSLNKVSFVPASGVSGSVTIPYTAKDSSGNTYTGTVVVKTFQGVDTVLTYSTTGRPVAFSVADFTNACAKKLNTTLSYVQFSLPSASQGTLYYGYGTAQKTPVSVNSKYTVGTHLQYISFLPKAGFSGTATISYTGYDTAGTSYTGKITVTVTPPAKSSYFTDATESWIAPAADFLYSNGVYSGVVSGTTLGVRNQITRGEVMQMIYNAFNLKSKVPTVTSNFTDVPANHAYYTAINAGHALGIALGDQGKFRPSEPITRQDAMTLLYRAFTKLGLNLTTGTANDLKSFADYAKVDSYATDALASMVKSGIIQGDNGNINPKGNLTRGEISVILYRAMTL